MCLRALPSVSRSPLVRQLRLQAPCPSTAARSEPTKGSFLIFKNSYPHCTQPRTPWPSTVCHTLPQPTTGLQGRPNHRNDIYNQLSLSILKMVGWGLVRSEVYETTLSTGSKFLSPRVAYATRASELAKAKGLRREVVCSHQVH